MIRVYFVYEDPMDESGINLSFIDVRTKNPAEAIDSVEKAAASGKLWKNLYPADGEHPYILLATKMMYLDISALPRENEPEMMLA